MSDNRRIKDTHEYNFMTSSIVKGLPVFESEEVKMILINSLKFCQENKGLEIAGWVLMINHFHLIARAAEGKKLSGIMRDFKRFTATQLKNYFFEKDPEHPYVEAFKKRALSNRKNNQFQIWEEGLYAHILNSDKRFYQKLEYIHSNPVRARLVAKPEDYKWSSAIDFAGGKGLLELSDF